MHVFGNERTLRSLADDAKKKISACTTRDVKDYKTLKSPIRSYDTLEEEETTEKIDETT